MSLQQIVTENLYHPEAMELAYQQARKEGNEQAFTAAVASSYAQNSDNLLLAAWHYRLLHAATKVKERVIAWNWALPLGILNGLLLWALSDDQRFNLRILNPLTGDSHTLIPLIALLAVPISAWFITLFLTAVGNKRWSRVALAAVILALSAGYVLLLHAQIWPRLFQEQYLALMVLHLGLLGWAAVGFTALARPRDAENRLAFLAKSLEVLVVAGVLAIAGGIFTAITIALFAALNVEIPPVVQRLFIAGGGGLIALVAAALVYDPALEPSRQSFEEGLSKLVALLMRLLLPLTVTVLLVYLAFIPFNWREPFDNRDVLITFNVMLFAVVALLVGASPAHTDVLSERMQTWLRRGMMALAVLALLVSLYALAAIVYRTVLDRLTPNRLTFIGWNLVNIAILALLLLQQRRAGRANWLAALQRTFATGVTLYFVWTIVALLSLPWLFRGNPIEVANLSPRIQQIVYDRPEPIILKCSTSPHIYLLQDGKKRWIKDIPTFEARGYRWNDVVYIFCDELREVPDGQPIPPDAGPPPQP
ncbi:MAG: hypothetical protein WAZ19_11825 [Anaerolineae bacterium]